MSQPVFDLWREPWIRVRGTEGHIGMMGLREALHDAHRWRDLADPSPLAVVGIHRLLVAIVQDALRPETTRDLVALWQAGGLPEAALEAFEATYADRFDLFSAGHPFLQSGDLPAAPGKGDRVKTVLFLHPDWPAGGEATHYRHGQDADAALCPACAAAGLVLQPAFATSGGSGIKPSINGVPPLYVLPQGETLAESLVASLVTCPYQPRAADGEEDLVWWRHPPQVGFKHERQRVGYLHSLTFPARQVRLHPEEARGRACARCGARGEWLVRTMVYNMGESRQGGAQLWQDPFAAYRPRKHGKGEPLPLRPRAGRALWRDYAALFLNPGRANGQGTIRPSVLAQIDLVAERAGWDAARSVGVRCIGMRTDMKAKVFEWVDEGLQVPLALLHSPQAAVEIEDGLAFGERLQGDLRYAWSQYLEERTGRHGTQRQRMLERYWASLAPDFERYALACAAAAGPSAADDEVDAALYAARRAWALAVCRAGQHAFEEAAAQLGDDAATLRERVQGQAFCRALTTKHRKEFAPDDR